MAKRQPVRDVVEQMVEMVEGDPSLLRYAFWVIADRAFMAGRDLAYERGASGDLDAMQFEMERRRRGMGYG